MLPPSSGTEGSQTDGFREPSGLLGRQPKEGGSDGLGRGWQELHPGPEALLQGCPVGSRALWGGLGGGLTGHW